MLDSFFSIFTELFFFGTMCLIAGLGGVVLIAIVCLDDNKGMLFNKRRQSRDRKVTERVLELAGETRLWIDPFSAKLFGDGLPENITADKEYLQKAGKGEFCFVETAGLKAAEDGLEKLVIFWWNRRYPSDVSLDLELEDWRKISEQDFAGMSHEKITEAVYRRKIEPFTEKGKTE